MKQEEKLSLLDKMKIIFSIIIAMIGLWTFANILADISMNGFCKNTSLPDERIDNVERVMQQGQPEDFILWIRNGNVLTPRQVDTLVFHKYATIVLDVGSIKDQFVLLKNRKPACSGDLESQDIEIHLYDSKNLEGGRSGGKYPYTTSPL